MRFRNVISLDEAEVLAGLDIILRMTQKLSDKYVTAWSGFGIDVSNVSM